VSQAILERDVNESSAGAAVPASGFPPLRLKRGEERRLATGHAWIFSNEVATDDTPLTAFQPGDLVRVETDRGRFLGYAYVNPHSLICARLLSRDPAQVPNKSLLVHRLQLALSLRRRLTDYPCYRLVYGESDELPGLVLDRYGDIVVGQVGTAGMERLKDELAAAIEKVVRPTGLLWRNDGGARELEGLPSYVETAFGEIPSEVTVVENGVRFQVPVLEGQKTGWFFDQAANRRLFLEHVAGARVLDVFSYLGAWGIQAARHGAADVTCVDSSAVALDWLQQNARANSVKVNTVKGDAFEVLQQLHDARERFDLVVLDPPAFIKRRKDIPKGQAAYRKLNQLGLQLLARDGLLVSNSCSYHLAEADLLAAIQRAARHASRFVQVLAIGGQAPDHPIHPAIPETRYLKAFFCRVVQDTAA
jgi:23S rRNA (cytosine1962-C5)-methyltransferase